MVIRGCTCVNSGDRYGNPGVFFAIWTYLHFSIVCGSKVTDVKPVRGEITDNNNCTLVYVNIRICRIHHL